MSVSLKFLIAFFVIYILVKGFLFWRLNLALKRMEAKQQALKNLPSFDVTRPHAGSPRPGSDGSGSSPLSEL